MRGPKPKDPSILALHGNQSKSIPESSKDIFPEGLGMPPEGLGVEELAIWNEVEEALPAGIVRKIDRELVRRYVQSVALLRRLKKAVAETPPSDRGFATLVRLAQAEATGQLKMEEALCWTPSSRNRVVPSPPKSNEKDSFDAFLARPRDIAGIRVN
jgi:hypothetical protein